MIIVVEGTKSFNNYDTFVRAMGVALSSIKNDNSVEIWSIGPHNVNNYTAAFCNITENYLRQKGIKISFHRMHHSVAENNMHRVNYYAFFGDKKDPVSKICASAELNGVETGIFRA